MAKTFTVTCNHCQRSSSFEIEDIEGLEGHIDNERDKARSSGYDAGFADAEDECPECPEQADIAAIASRPLWALAAALRSGDIVEAEAQLDRIAEEIGLEAIEQVQQGRFSVRARAA